MIIDSKATLNSVVAHYRAVLSKYGKVKLTSAHQAFARTLGFKTQASLIAALPLTVNRETKVHMEHTCNLQPVAWSFSVEEKPSIFDLFPFKKDPLDLTSDVLDSLNFNLDDRFELRMAYGMMGGIGPIFAKKILNGDKTELSLLLSGWVKMCSEGRAGNLGFITGADRGLVYLIEQDVSEAGLNEYIQEYIPGITVDSCDSDEEVLEKALSILLKKNNPLGFSRLFEHRGKLSRTKIKELLLYLSAEASVSSATLGEAVDALLAEGSNPRVSWDDVDYSGLLSLPDSKERAEVLLKLKPPLRLIRTVILQLPLMGEKEVDDFSEKANEILELLLAHTNYNHELPIANKYLEDVFRKVAGFENVIARFLVLKKICEHYNKPWRDLGKTTIVNLSIGVNSYDWGSSLGEQDLVDKARSLFKLGIDEPEEGSEYHSQICEAVGSAVYRKDPIVMLNYLYYLDTEYGILIPQKVVTQLCKREAEYRCLLGIGVERFEDEYIEKYFPCLVFSKEWFDLNLHRTYLETLCLEYLYVGEGRAIKFVEEASSLDLNFLFAEFPSKNRLHQMSFETPLEILVPALLGAFDSSQSTRHVAGRALLDYLGREVVGTYASTTKLKSIEKNWCET